MTFLMILIVLIALSYAALLVRTVRHDGLGHRPSPRSHRDWDEAPTV